jgi:tryptophanyl-tRNA synthetase
MKRVFSGVQPTGKLHLGNYIGALSVWAANQDMYHNVFCVADLHAITVPDAIDPVKLREKTREVAGLFLASGIDPKKSIVFVQSHVHEHAEMAWLLACVTPVGWLYRMTQFKEKSKNSESVGTGLLEYPVLQAADILLYDTDLVPVGEDQKQHIEISRDIAQRFNNLFGEVLVLPEPLIRASGARIMGLDDPEAKMSKSTGEIKKGHSIGLLDAPDEIRRAIARATTDSGNEALFDSAKSGVRNLLTLYEVLSGESRATIEERFHGKGYGTLKKQVGELAVEKLRPVREKYTELRADPAYLDTVLADGAERARAVAQKTLQRVKEKMGLDTYKKPA